MLGEEGIDAIKMGFSFLFLSALLVFTVKNVTMGKDTVNQFVNRIDQTEDETMMMTFSKLKGEGIEVPTAAAYAFINYNENSIKSIKCCVENESGVVVENIADSCIKNHLSGKCVLQAKYDNYEALYEILILKPDTAEGGS